MEKYKNRFIVLQFCCIQQKFSGNCLKKHKKPSAGYENRLLLPLILHKTLSFPNRENRQAKGWTIKNQKIKT